LEFLASAGAASKTGAASSQSEVEATKINLLIRIWEVLHHSDELIFQYRKL
jgi:hypothetical protein